VSLVCFDRSSASFVCATAANVLHFFSIREGDAISTSSHSSSSTDSLPHSCQSHDSNSKHISQKIAQALSRVCMQMRTEGDAVNDEDAVRCVLLYIYIYGYITTNFCVCVCQIVWQRILIRWKNVIFSQSSDFSRTRVMFWH
jgi:hypothetical protein